MECWGGKVGSWLQVQVAGCRLQVWEGGGIGWLVSQFDFSFQFTLYGRTNRVRGRTNRVDTGIGERGGGVMERWVLGWLPGKRDWGWFHLFGSVCRFTMYGSTQEIGEW